MSKHIRIAIAAAIAMAWTATPSAAVAIGPSNQLPPQLVAETKIPERWFTPQIVDPGAQAIATNGQRGEDPNPCTFPYRFWAYHSLTPTWLSNGDLRLHIIRVVSYQTVDARSTVFETDNFHVLIHHTHPLKNWTITGRYGQWFLGSKVIWREAGMLSATPTPTGGETVVDPHPGPLTTKPNLCTALSTKATR
jgi:hypothetical protein